MSTHHLIEAIAEEEQHYIGPRCLGGAHVDGRSRVPPLCRNKRCLCWCHDEINTLSRTTRTEAATALVVEPRQTRNYAEPPTMIDFTQERERMARIGQRIYGR